MERLTTDNPKSNHETLMNYCTASDGWAVLKYAGGEENIKLHEYAAKCCQEHGCENMTADMVVEDGLMDCYDCPVAIMYYCGAQAAENNAWLAAYEDTGITPEQITKMQNENAKLRELLKLAVANMDDIITDCNYTYNDCDSYDDELCVRHCARNGCNCFKASSDDPCKCDNFRWQYADEVEEVLKNGE